MKPRTCARKRAPAPCRPVPLPVQLRDRPAQATRDATGRKRQGPGPEAQRARRFSKLAMFYPLRNQLGGCIGLPLQDEKGNTHFAEYGNFVLGKPMAVRGAGPSSMGIVAGSRSLMSSVCIFCKTFDAAQNFRFVISMFEL